MIDKVGCDILDKIEILSTKLSQTSANEELSTLVSDRMFTFITADGRTVEAVPNGSLKPVTVSNAYEYVQRVYELRIHEFDSQIDAMIAGLASQVPINILRLFTWQELELLVVGKSEIDLYLLRRVTVYSSPYHAGHPTVRYFWQMMENFSQPERAAMLKFVWSRERLPLRVEDFPCKFTFH